MCTSSIFKVECNYIASLLSLESLIAIHFAAVTYFLLQNIYAIYLNVNDESKQITFNAYRFIH